MVDECSAVLPPAVVFQLGVAPPDMQSQGFACFWCIEEEIATGSIYLCEQLDIAPARLFVLHAAVRLDYIDAAAFKKSHVSDELLLIVGVDEVIPAPRGRGFEAIQLLGARRCSWHRSKVSTMQLGLSIYH